MFWDKFPRTLNNYDTESYNLNENLTKDCYKQKCTFNDYLYSKNYRTMNKKKRCCSYNGTDT